MKRQTKVVIGVQARSTSERLPNKCLAEIGGKPMLRHVLDACHSSAKWLSSRPEQDISCTVMLLIPTGDHLKDHFKSELIIEGPELNVLARYEKAFRKMYPDYMVRITGDCPLIPDHLITKHIRSAVYNRLDYVSNVDPEYRTHIDGFDCEVISAKLVSWLFREAEEAQDLEHVTTLIRREPPSWAQFGSIDSKLDLSHINLSVDTAEDLEMVREIYDRGERKHLTSKSRNKQVFFL